MAEQDPEVIETYRGFLALGTRVWVRGDAIVVIRVRPLPDGGEGAEVLVRGQQAIGSNTGGYAVWTAYPAKAIIEAITVASQQEAQRVVDAYRDPESL